MTDKQEITQWLLKADPSIRYQTRRDLLDQDDKELQNRILNEGWGHQFLSRQNSDGHWGRGFYQPKWISSHYTLLDLKNLNPIQNVPQIQKTIKLILEQRKSEDGGVNPAVSIGPSDVCVNGMFLNYACYFRTPATELNSIVDCILAEQFDDGGFNCRSTRSGAQHSSLHTTISVLEGFDEYIRNNYTYRLSHIKKAKAQSEEFILQHRLYKSDKTGEIIHKQMISFPYPSRWKYDILRCLDYFRSASVKYDPRMQDALEVLTQKRKKDGYWNLSAKHPGQVHFEMEPAGKPSRWNTLRALRVSAYFNN